MLIFWIVAAAALFLHFLLRCSAYSQEIQILESISDEFEEPKTKIVG